MFDKLQTRCIYSTQPNGWKILSQSEGWPIHKLSVCVGRYQRRHTRSNHNVSPYVPLKLDFTPRWLERCSPPPSLLLSAGRARRQIFSFGSVTVLPERFINPAHVRFLEPPSVFPSQQPPPVRPFSPPVFEGRSRCPSPGVACSGKHPAVQTRLGCSPGQAHAVKCTRGSLSLQTCTKKIPFCTPPSNLQNSIFPSVFPLSITLSSLFSLPSFCHSVCSYLI